MWVIGSRWGPRRPRATLLGPGEQVGVGLVERDQLLEALDHIDAVRSRPRLQQRTLAAYLLQIAMLGGYLARNHDPPPGNMVVWRGLTRLHDIAVGISIGARRRCG